LVFHRHDEIVRQHADAGQEHVGRQLLELPRQREAEMREIHHPIEGAWNQEPQEFGGRPLEMRADERVRQQAIRPRHALRPQGQHRREAGRHGLLRIRARAYLGNRRGRRKIHRADFGQRRSRWRDDVLGIP